MVDWQRIESGMTAGGIPDLNGCYDGIELWIEHKIVQGLSVDLTPLQIGWLLHRWKHGGRCYILAWEKHDGGPRKGAPVSRLYLWRGCDAREVSERGVRAALITLGVWDEPFTWSEILMTLFNGRRR